MGLHSSAARRARVCIAGLALAALSCGAHAASAAQRGCAGVDYNAMILDILKTMPKGGGYSLNADVVQMPKITVHNIGTPRWEMRVYDGRPSHCTGATYAVFAHLVAVLHNGGAITLTPDQLQSLAVLRTMPNGTARVDGQGLFGIFNANGAGVAALLKHTGAGFSFRDDKLAHARAGDFLKLFWNDNVGSSEQGHQVVYLGKKTEGDRDMICFWGSQHQGKKKRSGGTGALYFPAAAGDEVKDGYGEVCRPRSDIKEMIFSRVTCMEHLAAGLDEMQAKAEASGGYVFVDDYLYALREKSSDHATLDQKYDIAPAPAEFADIMPGLRE
jgi:hypothetical protein